MQNRSIRGFTVPVSCACALVGVLLAGCIEERDQEWQTWQPSPHTELSTVADDYAEQYGLSCRVETRETDSGVRVRMTLFNANAHDIEFLGWRTLWDPYYPPFDFPDADAAVSYVGWRASGSTAPTDDAFVRIPNESSVTAEYSLDHHYVAQQAGSYAIRLKNPVLVIRMDGEQLALQHTCGQGSVYVSDDLGVEPDGFSSSEQELSAHSGCSDANEQIMNNAFDVAHSAVTVARRVVDDDSVFYEEWFGDWTPWNGDEVAAHMDQILGSAWDTVVRCGGNGGSVFNCCNTKRDGCIYDDVPLVGSRVYLCESWFSHPTLSVEHHPNQVGILVHELTHAAVPTVNWGQGPPITHPFPTDDFDYGAAAARGYADDCHSDACVAVRSAENYEFFVSDALVTAIVATAL
jgi:hypothetical protein